MNVKAKLSLFKPKMKIIGNYPEILIFNIKNILTSTELEY